MGSRAARKTDRRLAARVAATASLGAAIIHFAVAPTHGREWLPSGVFFAVLAVFQLAWAVLVLTRPPALVLVAGVVANLGSIAMWAVSRTAGVPFGPHAGEPEMVQAAGLCALLLQIYVVLSAAWMWFRGHRADLVPGFGYRVVLAGAGTVVATAAALGVTSGLQHGHHPPAGTAEHDHHAPDLEVGDRHHDHLAPAQPLDAPITRLPMAPAPLAPPTPAEEPAHADGHEHDHG